MKSKTMSLPTTLAKTVVVVASVFRNVRRHVRISGETHLCSSASQFVTSVIGAAVSVAYFIIRKRPFRVMS
jgi:hypothetical protein